MARLLAEIKFSGKSLLVIASVYYDSLMLIPSAADNLQSLAADQGTPKKTQLHELMRREALPDGLHFVALKDGYSGLYAVPSHQNFFGPLCVPNVIIASGCKSLLIAISSSAMLNDIFTSFSDDNKHIFHLSNGVGATGGTLVLNVRFHSAMRQLPVRLGVDRFSTEEVPATIRGLRFFLSSQDAAQILADPAKLSRINMASDHTRLESHAQLSVPPLPVTLLGNLVLDQFSEIKHWGVRFFVDLSKLHIDTTGEITNLVHRVTTALQLDQESRAALAKYADVLDLVSDDWWAESNYDF